MKDNKGITGLFILLLSTIFALLIIKFVFNAPQKFEDIGLGEGTTSYFAFDRDSTLIHIGRLNQSEDSALMHGWTKRGKRDILFCLGNSQTHGINKFVEGQKTYNGLLFDTLQNIKIDVLTNSLPNANLQEHYLLFDYWRHKLPIKYLLLPVFMDDLREEGIREVFMPLLISNHYLLDSSRVVAKKINGELLKMGQTTEVPPKDIAALYKTVQEKSETYLNQKLENNIDIWKSRPNVRGDLFLKLYLWRNSILGINAQTKRKMIPSHYRDNFDALKAILEDAQKANIKVLVYIPPIRMDIAIPYDKQEYTQFKKEVENLTLQYKHQFCNLENVVPGQYWGLKQSTNTSGKLEYDFMHFQYIGHKLLANNLFPQIKKMIQQ